MGTRANKIYKIPLMGASNMDNVHWTSELLTENLPFIKKSYQQLRICGAMIIDAKRLQEMSSVAENNRIIPVIDKLDN